ncbi:MAG TPA: PIG-L family deacetylase [Stellaceae bacterium]|nr:PIG-L family deacetylase [Stellaceae bacterium]
MKAVLDELANRRPVEQRVMIVVAHPDDETIGMGACLCLLRNTLLVHVTDGAPRDGRDAAMHGFANAADYAAARRAELAAALAAGGAGAVRTAAIDIADQEAHANLPRLVARLRDLIEAERPAAIFTHTYEGGHPDHDAAAFAVATAVRLLTPDEPVVIEMPLYRAAGDGIAKLSFLPVASPVTELLLTPEERARKQRMVACFRSQAAVLAGFELDAERFRPAPSYDFTLPPHPGVLNYERLGWGITGAAWRATAVAAQADFGLC